MNHLIISGINVSDRADVGVERVGRFSGGLEQLPETARKLRQGRFSDGWSACRRRATTGSTADASAKAWSS